LGLRQAFLPAPEKAAMRDSTRVLVVEDEWLIAEGHASAVRAAGCDVVGPAPSSAAASRLLRTERIDAALLDAQLKDGRSFGLAEELSARAIPFAFVSGFSDIDAPARLSRQPCLLKPTSQAEIVATIRKLLEG
jgi:DNA-binding response OmpR family regulator